MTAFECSLNQIVQIFYDTVDQSYSLPPLPEDEIIDTGVLALKDVMVGIGHSANVNRLFISQVSE
jgi:hypothetical protein